MTSRDFPFSKVCPSSLAFCSGRGIGCPEIEENRDSVGVKNGVAIDRHRRLATIFSSERCPSTTRPLQGIALHQIFPQRCWPCDISAWHCSVKSPPPPLTLVHCSQWPQSHPSSLREARAHLRSHNIHHLSTFLTNCCHLLSPFHPMLPLFTQHFLRPPLLPSTPIPSSSHGDALSISPNHPFWTPFSALSTSRREYNNSTFSQSSRLMDQMILLIPSAACISTA
jgi:hypothetical protein